jgi:hypothetical protein
MTSVLPALVIVVSLAGPAVIAPAPENVTTSTNEVTQHRLSQHGIGAPFWYEVGGLVAVTVFIGFASGWIGATAAMRMRTTSIIARLTGAQGDSATVRMAATITAALITSAPLVIGVGILLGVAWIPRAVSIAVAFGILESLLHRSAYIGMQPMPGMVEPGRQTPGGEPR